MKVNFKINTLRGIFLCLTMNKESLCHRTVFARKESADFSLHSKRLTLSFALIFAREQKCINNHFGVGICAGMVVTNTTFVPGKILNQCFSP
jgi:hypothetical protein